MNPRRARVVFGMRCAVCDKESSNRRVCPFCFTPYPPEATQSRTSSGTGRQTTGAHRVTTGSHGMPVVVPEGRVGETIEMVRAFVMRQTPVVRWTGAAILVILLFWTFTDGDAGTGAAAAPGSVPSTLVATPEMREEALALIKQTRESALVETQADEMSVSYPAADFPLEDAGQLTLAQQFARADEIVEGRKRRIFFYNPAGRLFAQSDGVTGVTIVR